MEKYVEKTLLSSREDYPTNEYVKVFLVQYRPLSPSFSSAIVLLRTEKSQTLAKSSRSCSFGPSVPLSEVDARDSLYLLALYVRTSFAVIANSYTTKGLLQEVAPMCEPDTLISS
jgi:hypothetical protein